MPDVDLAIILADGDYLKRQGNTLIGAIPPSGTGAVTSVNGETGAVTLNAADIPMDPAGGWGANTVEAVIAYVNNQTLTKAPLAQTIEAVTGTTYTVTAADSNKIKRLAATATVTLGTALATGERVDFVCVGGPATFTLSGATWDVAPTPSAVARAIGSMITAIKMGATTWALTGDLA